MPSPYEERAHREILAWRSPSVGVLGKVMQFVNRPLDWAGDAILATPGVGPLIQKSVGGLVNIMNEGAQWSVRPSAIYEEYRCRGHGHVHSAADLLSLDLEQVDRTIGRLAAKYKGIALAEGAATGALGLPGIPPDIIALVGLNLRAIGEHATYCGFDVALPQERLFALNVLSYASSASDASKAAAMAQLVRIAQDAARKRAWKDLQTHAFVQIMQRVAKALGTRLTKAKLAQIVPAAGAVVGGGFNAYFTAKVCDAAFFLYRERFLANKYGPEMIVPPTPSRQSNGHADHALPGESVPPPP